MQRCGEAQCGAPHPEDLIQISFLAARDRHPACEGILSACENLKSLDIRDTFVTGSIARLFRPLHNLEVLDLKGTAVEDIGEFKRAHPNCRITGFSLSRRRYRATGESTAW